MPTHYKGTKEEVTVLNVFIKLTRSTESLFQYLSIKLKRYGITEAQFGVLEMLYHLGPLQQNQIARKLLRSRGNITFIIDKLEKMNLVKRVVDAEDRRCTEVYLTPKGEALIKKIFPMHLKEIVSIFSVLNSNEKQLLEKICKKISKRILTQKEDKPQ
ncbi:MAG: MarR family transcriptional regulator [bacterium]|nr:MarR family transcriptional regulator [bacterium]